MDFIYERFVQYHETDMMGVVHHSNYIKWMEETRVAWLRAMKLEEHHAPLKDFTLAVLESQCRHTKPCFFNEKIQVKIKVYSEKLKVRFYYGIYSKNQLCAYGQTLHIGVDKNLKVLKPEKEILKYVESGTWTETWPLSL